MRYQPFSINGRYLSLTALNLFHFIIFLETISIGSWVLKVCILSGKMVVCTPWDGTLPGSDRASFLEQVSRDLALRDSSDAAVSRARIHEKHQKKRRKERSKRGVGKGWWFPVGWVAVVWIFLCGWDRFFWGIGLFTHIPNIFCQVANPKKSEMPSCWVGCWSWVRDPGSWVCWKGAKIEAGEAGEDGDEDEGLLDSSYSVCTS